MLVSDDSDDESADDTGVDGWRAKQPKLGLYAWRDFQNDEVIGIYSGDVKQTGMEKVCDRNVQCGRENPFMLTLVTK